MSDKGTRLINLGGQGERRDFYGSGHGNQASGRRAEGIGTDDHETFIGGIEGETGTAWGVRLKKPTPSLNAESPGFGHDPEQTGGFANGGYELTLQSDPRFGTPSEDGGFHTGPFDRFAAESDVTAAEDPTERIVIPPKRPRIIRFTRRTHH
jgi:hypothetical protein